MSVDMAVGNNVHDESYLMMRLSRLAYNLQSRNSRGVSKKVSTYPEPMSLSLQRRVDWEFLPLP